MIVTYVRWGSAPPYTITRYEFRTLSEHEAFVQGVDEACGWMEYRFIEEGECRRCGHRRDAHSAAGACTEVEAGGSCTAFESYVSFERTQGKAASQRQLVAELEEAFGKFEATSYLVESSEGSTTLLVGRCEDERYRITVTQL